MKTDKLPTLNINELLEIYVEAAAGHGTATLDGNYRKANRHHDALAAVYRELRSRGTAAQRSLLGLLNHPNAGVRCWAAAHALEFAPDEGEPVLEALTKTPGIFALDAEMALQEWRKGALKFP